VLLLQHVGVAASACDAVHCAYKGESVSGHDTNACEEAAAAQEAREENEDGASSGNATPAFGRLHEFSEHGVCNTTCQCRVCGWG